MLRLNDSLTRSIREFVALEEGKAKVYTCGPTVYDFVTIGNWRTYTMGDVVVRTLMYLGYDVKYVMNITDVGHLTGDNLGDADTGEDRLEKASKRENKNAWDIAEFYANDFLEKFKMMNLVQPFIFSKATDHIPEQIDLVVNLEEKGFAYKISDGIYFDTKAFEAHGNKYGELSNLDMIKEGARVEINTEKRDPRDFALWKFSKSDEQRHMEWDSPFGKGFPGWHIECSAMAMKYLGETLDIHLGGEDLRSTHHPNEIAQSEAATGKKFANYWIHGAFLQVDGGRMGKSLGNAYSLADLVALKYNPMHLRYFYFTGHYKKHLNFTFASLDAAKTAYERLKNKVRDLMKDANKVIDSPRKNEDGGWSIDQSYSEMFTAALEDDLNMPEAIAVVWELVKSDLRPEIKLTTLLDFDQVLGLRIEEMMDEPHDITEVYSDEVRELITKRDEARADRDWKSADEIRDKLKIEFGIEVKDK